MTWVASAVAVGTAGSQIYAGNQASKKQAKAGKAAQEEEYRQQAQQRADQSPYRQIGAGATNKLAGLFGIGGVSGYDDRVVGAKVFKPSEVGDLLAQGMSVDQILKLGRLESGAKTSDLNWLMSNRGINADDLGRLKSGTFSPLVSSQPNPDSGSSGPNFSDFYNTPGYQWQLDQGKKAIERSAAARGGLASGNTLGALTKYGQGLADQTYNQYVSNLMNLMQTGQNSTNALMGADMVSSGRIADSYNTIGNANASGVANQGNALGDLFGTLGGLWAGSNRKQTPRTSGLRVPNPNTYPGTGGE